MPCDLNVVSICGIMLYMKEGGVHMAPSERQKDILKIIAQLDISPTMYQNAVEKYQSIAKYLESNGIEADMYPQGSFALGTVVRPFTKDPNAAYDLDFICQMKVSKNDMSPAELRKAIEDILCQSDLYKEKLVICAECLTIEYADINGVSFSIDVVPAVDETEEKKSQLRLISENPDLIDDAIAIPEKYEEDKEVYDWMTNNPRGYRIWFDRINEPFRINNQMERRQQMFENNRAVFASAEEIPEGLDRSAMQQVIQILKHHRNVYYDKIPNGDSTKPISAIISTIVARIASQAFTNSSVFDLLIYVLGELDIYSMQQTLSDGEFSIRYQNKTAVRRKGEKWVIENPANPGDNLADQWNEDSITPVRFFAWLKAVRENLVDSLMENDDVFRTKIENAFGRYNVQKTWGTKYGYIAPKPITSSSPAKPWKA